MNLHLYPTINKGKYARDLLQPIMKEHEKNSAWWEDLAQIPPCGIYHLA